MDLTAAETNNLAVQTVMHTPACPWLFFWVLCSLGSPIGIAVLESLARRSKYSFCVAWFAFPSPSRILYRFYLFAKMLLNLSLPSPTHSTGLDPSYFMCVLHMLGAISFFTLFPLIVVLSGCRSVIFLFVFKLSTGELFPALGLAVSQLCRAG